MFESVATLTDRTFDSFNVLIYCFTSEENPRKTDRAARFYIGTVCIQNGHATNRATALGVGFQTCGCGRGRSMVPMQDILLKNDQNEKHEKKKKNNSVKDNFEFIFHRFY